MFTGSAFIDPPRPFRPTGAPTPSRLFAEEFARALSPKDVARFDRGLQNIEIGADQFVRGRTNDLHPRCSGGATVLDTVTCDEVLVVYADGRVAGGVVALSVPLVALQKSLAIATSLDAATRRRTLVDTTISLRPKTRPRTNPRERWPSVADEFHAVALDLTVIAGLLVTDAELETLAAIRGAVAALAIVARTDTRARPDVDTRHFVSKFPGQWLGTTSPAGRA